MTTKQLSTIRRHVVGFNYDSLAADKREFVQEKTAVIHSLHSHMADAAVNIGQHLAEVRNQMEAVYWAAWLKSEFGWSADSGRRLIKAAEQFAGLDCLGKFVPSALLEFARDSVPEPARQEAIVQARAGQTITLDRAKEIVGKHRPETVQQAAPRRDSVYRLRNAVRRFVRHWQGDRSQLNQQLAEIVRETLAEFNDLDLKAIPVPPAAARKRA